MTILTAAQNAMARLVGRRPAAIVSSTNEMEVEITSLAQEAAVEIAKSHEWQVLTARNTISGTGAESYPLPDDFDRMHMTAGVSSPSWPNWWFSHARSLDEWEQITIRGINLEPGWWIILGDRFQTLPVIPAGGEARFFYISKNIFAASNGAPKDAITADTDSFRLDERLLTLSIIWRWLALKRMDYSEELRTYEFALSQEQARDGGSRVMRANGTTRFPGAVPSWPWELG